jgi:GT2 family glycosyltransferase
VTSEAGVRNPRAARNASVIVASRERPGLLERCLKALEGQHVSPAELIVVDNTSGDAATRAIAERAGARYLLEPRRGVSHARNAGARAAAGEIVAFTDDDAVPDAGWLAALASEFDDASVAAVSGLTLRIDDGAGRLSSHPIFGAHERIVLDRGAPDWFERASFGGIVGGCNLAIRRTAFATWPGFDVRLGAGTSAGGMEEHHAFFTLIDAGHRVVYTPAAKVHHPAPETAEDLRQEHLRAVRAAGFFLALVIAEHPRQRRRAARYAVETITGATRTWRLAPPNPAASRLLTARGATWGILLYLTSRSRRRGAQSDVRAARDHSRPRTLGRDA